MIKKSKFIFIALSPTGSGISGGDRIFIELAREWSKKTPVNIYTTQEGIEMSKRLKLSGRFLSIKKNEKHSLPSVFLLKYLYKIISGIKLGFLFQYTNYINRNIFLYSTSDFWMDVFPAVILKIRYPKMKWVATWFQTAPNPFVGYSEGDRKEKYKLSAFLYWFSQLPVRFLMNKYADFIIVNNEDERKQFPGMDRKGKVIVLIGAVRLDEIKKYQSSHQSPRKIYDAVFQGRFHPQKGVVELIDIWKLVVNKIPDAMLAMIGDGPLMDSVKKKIEKLGLENNIKLFGYLFDGPEKYRIFSQSKIVVHPAYYDSGGMASAEAMSFELPAVGFNLKSYESYYPEGMVKIKFGDMVEFSDVIVGLVEDKNYRNKLGKKAVSMIENNWSWKRRAEEVLSKIR